MPFACVSTRHGQGPCSAHSAKWPFHLLALPGWSFLVGKTEAQLKNAGKRCYKLRVSPGRGEEVTGESCEGCDRRKLSGEGERQPQREEGEMKIS